VKAVMGGRTPVAVEDLQGQSSSKGAAKREVYNWFTLSPIAKRQIVVYYGYSGKNDTGGAEVLEVQTDEQQRALPIPTIPLTAEEEAAHKKSAPQGMAGPGGGGGQGGGRGKRQRPAATDETKPESAASEGDAKPTEEPKTEGSDAPKDDKPAPTGEEKPAAPAEKPGE
jgi:hypothetical protein